MSYTLILLVKAMLNINGAYILALMESVPKLEGRTHEGISITGEEKKSKDQ